MRAAAYAEVGVPATALAAHGLGTEVVVVPKATAPVLLIELGCGCVGGAVVPVKVVPAMGCIMIRMVGVTAVLVNGGPVAEMLAGPRGDPGHATHASGALLDLGHGSDELVHA
jgi:hypothetical protein